MLEEAFQGFADGIALRWGEQVLQLLVEGPPLNLDARGENLCNPLQGGERGGGGRGVSRVRVCKAQVERKESSTEQGAGLGPQDEPCSSPVCWAGVRTVQLGLVCASRLENHTGCGATVL